ncbi:hypothetical protein [Aedoeadaptatus coxii]|uniref:Uncharacterized protein n=1 Tax=Aedoeadaptatus coxii TaxID=755172 RepID=A0A134AIC2_9FIRM|nr:hypothetical protein [Peptoniphilus coxii]KXB67395.1 hypothetical protein HMPREF1863_00585 [Peptoniphilus coxii]
MEKKLENMALEGKLSYVLAGVLFLLIPCLGFSMGAHSSVISPEGVYTFFGGAMLVAALAKQRKLVFMILAGSLFLSSVVMAIMDIAGVLM